MTVEIPLTDTVPHYEFSLDLEAVSYIFVVRYNERMDRWSMDIYNADREPLRLGELLLPSYPLFRGAAGSVTGFPPGTFFLLDVSEKERMPGFAGLGSDFKLYYEESAA